MKRRRRLFTSFPLQAMVGWAYGGDVIPPNSTVQANEDFRDKYGNEPLKVAYYSRVLGLNSVVLLDAEGKQRADITQKEFRTRFKVIERSNEDDDFQVRAPITERYWGSARGE